MRRRFRSTEGAAAGAVALACVLVCCLLVCFLLRPASARAELAGAVDARGLFGLDQRYGGALLAELWGRRGIVRPGVAVGIGALSAGDDESSRVITPLGFSLAVVPGRESSGFVAVARLGGYAGAEKGGFIAGGFASGAAGYAISLGEGASIRMTADVWALIGKRGGIFFGPALGFGF